MNIFFYTTTGGREPVREFLQELPAETRFEILTLLRRIEGGEQVTMPHVRSMATMAHGLYEIRVRDVQGHVRVFYYTKIKGSIFLLHGLRKKGATISEKDRNLILKRIGEISLKFRG